MLQSKGGITPPVDPYRRLRTAVGGRKNEYEALENSSDVWVGPGGSVVGFRAALKHHWPQMVPPCKEKSPPEQRPSRKAGSPHLKTQNSY